MSSGKALSLKKLTGVRVQHRQSGKDVSTHNKSMIKLLQKSKWTQLRGWVQEQQRFQVALADL